MSFPNNQSNPAGAIPVYLTSGATGGLVITNRSVSFNTGSNAAVPVNTARRYLFIQCVTPGVDIWINPVGGTAAVATAGSFKLAAGQTYESGSMVFPGAVAIYVPSNATSVTILEG